MKEEEEEKKNLVRVMESGGNAEQWQLRLQTERGSLSVWLFLITRRENDARELNLPWAHTGLWVDFDF